MQEFETRIDIIPETGRPHIFREPGYAKLKHVADIVIIFFFLPAFCLLLLLIMIAIKLYSPGPIFYRQKRIGKDGVPFDLLKFRSMRVGSDSQVHRAYVQRLIRENIRPEDVGSKSLKLSNDLRITGLGKILRSLGLDELPQFINVLRGEMSLVGPRPPMPYEYELYNDWHKQRLRALPGITGLWQVTAHNQVSFDEMVQIDLDYIESMSFWLDLKIMFLTPLEMLRSKGGG
jgi:lipopolysaccharide/colanic/teichoic acid biosynthesis glycosyltransferase